MVSMERELNKLFNDTYYNKENVIIREIWSIKLELQNFFWGVYMTNTKFGNWHINNLSVNADDKYSKTNKFWTSFDNWKDL